MKSSDVVRAAVRAAEDAVVKAIPKSLLETMEKVNAEFAAKGGCPGCGSKRLGVHFCPCSWCDKNPDLY